MSEGWAKHIASSDFEFFSAGTAPTSAVNPNAIKVMAEKGIDMSAKKPKTLDSVPMPDLIVAVCSHAAENCPVIPGTKTERWDLPDPAAFKGGEEETLNVFRDIRDEIESRVRDLVSRI